MTTRSDKQIDAVLRHLKERGTITPLEALQQYGCFRLAAVIHKLRGEHWPIQTELVYEDHKRYARYWLE